MSTTSPAPGGVPEGLGRFLFFFFFKPPFPIPTPTAGGTTGEGAAALLDPAPEVDGSELSPDELGAAGTGVDVALGGVGA